MNVGARLDVNSADATALESLFRTVAPPEAARQVARRLAAHVQGDDLAADSWRSGSVAAADSQASRDRLVSALLGRELPARARRPFRSLDELQDVVGEAAPWLADVAPLLTVDGDGRIDRRHALPAVRSAATGALVDRPTRILLVARGWQAGHPLAREIQAVYDVSGPTLTRVDWREVDR